jgi:hypothetical protein
VNENIPGIANSVLCDCRKPLLRGRREIEFGTTCPGEDSEKE